LFKGKRYQALISVDRRRRMMKRARLEKMERKGKKEGIKQVKRKYPQIRWLKCKQKLMRREHFQTHFMRTALP